jgi:hypothetical protein
MVALTLLLTALATARLTRLVTTDRITRAPRDWVLLRVRNGHPLAYLLGCDWCASMYVGAGAAAAWWAWGDHRWFVAATAALAFSHITGWLATREETS